MTPRLLRCARNDKALATVKPWHVYDRRPAPTHTKVASQSQGTVGVKQARIAPGSGLNLGHTLPTGLRIGLQTLLNAQPRLHPTLRQCVCIFDGHARTLGQIRQHGMRRIAQ